MKKIIFRLTTMGVYEQTTYLGKWTDATNQTMYLKFRGTCESLGPNGYMQIIDDGFAKSNPMKWIILTKIWAYNWAELCHITVRQSDRWCELNDSAVWCERQCYGIADQSFALKPADLRTIYLNQKHLSIDNQTIWTVSEEYLYGCQIITYMLTQYCQLTILKIRSVETNQWVGQRMMVTSSKPVFISIGLSTKAAWISNRPLRKNGKHVFYAAHDKLVIETQLFKKTFGHHRQLWEDYWQLFDIKWEKGYRWARLYRRLMYEVHFVKSIAEIQQLLWAPPLDVTGDFNCLTWQCDWVPILTGFWQQLIGGCFVDERLVIENWPRLPLLGRRELTFDRDGQKIKIRQTNQQMVVQPSKPLTVMSQHRKIQCSRQCWTVIWENY
ncbi:hypothetical protein [Weissella paramesenteroides]|uniref:hypothetical protein n=1 Tax=Weissella paramesenteroides TaxID=1249 RepID=UPI00388F63D5